MAQAATMTERQIEPLTDAEAEAALITLAETLDGLGCCPVVMIDQKEDEGVSFSLHFSVDRARKLAALQGSAALPSEASEEMLLSAFAAIGWEPTEVDRDLLRSAYAAMRAAAPTAPVQDEQCERCAGTGEIITDDERYDQPPPGDKGDEAVGDCPDCGGMGHIEALSPTPDTGLIEALKKVRHWRSKYDLLSALTLPAREWEFIEAICARAIANAAPAQQGRPVPPHASGPCRALPPCPPGAFK